MQKTTVDKYNFRRDANGRFAPGTQGGPGRPKKQVEQEYLDIIHEVVPPERYRSLVEKVASHIEQTGSIRAFEALSDRMFGKPRMMEPEENEGDGLKALFAQLDIIPHEEAGNSPVQLPYLEE